MTDFGPIEGQNTGLPAARRSRRFKIFEPAAMTCKPGEKRVHLLDVSTTGARADCENPPVAGELVSIRCGPLTSEARISWVRGSRFGLTFRHPIDDDLIARLVNPPADVCMAPAADGEAFQGGG